MKNKLGLFDCNNIERQIVNLKLNLIDEYFTFNKDKLDFEYLVKLHDFLFADLYFENQIGIRPLLEEELNNIEMMLENIINFCIIKNVEDVLNTIQEIWMLQPFYNGNTRTFLAYLKILNNAFSLGLSVDVNKEIESKFSTFDKENFVNQKRLTKNK